MLLGELLVKDFNLFVNTILLLPLTQKENRVLATLFPVPPWNFSTTTTLTLPTHGLSYVVVLH